MTNGTPGNDDEKKDEGVWIIFTTANQGKIAGRVAAIWSEDDDILKTIPQFAKAIIGGLNGDFIPVSSAIQLVANIGQSGMRLQILPMDYGVGDLMINTKDIVGFQRLDPEGEICRQIRAMTSKIATPAGIIRP